MSIRHLGLAVIGALATPAVLLAQLPRNPMSSNNRVPEKDAKLVMITAFKSPAPAPTDKGPRLGARAAEEMRDKVQRAFSLRQVFVIPVERINQQLEGSGFSTSEGLAPHDAKTLATTLRADEHVAGSIARLPSGSFRAEADLVLTRDIAARQPLGVAEAPKMDDALDALVKELKEARKQLDGERKCTNAARDGKFAEAVEFANAAIVAYPKATLARMCLVSVLFASKAPTAEVVKIAHQLVALDSRSNFGLKYLVEVYRAEKQSDSLVNVLTRMMRNDPTNTDVARAAIDEIARATNPGAALPIIDEAISANPGDPDLLKARWQILFAVRKYKEMFEAGRDLMRLDTAFADTTYFQRTAVAFAADSQWQQAAATLATGVSKFPTDALLAGLEVQALQKAGEPQQALDKLDIALSKKVPIAQSGYMRLSLLQELKKSPVDIVAAARGLIVAGDTTENVRQTIINQASVLFSGGQKAQADPGAATQQFVDALGVLAYADSVVTRPQRPQVWFLIGAVNIMLAPVKFNAAVAARSCALAKEAQGHVVEGQINLPKGVSQNNADIMQRLMSLAMQTQPVIEQLVRSIPNCR